MKKSKDFKTSWVSMLIAALAWTAPIFLIHPALGSLLEDRPGHKSSFAHQEVLDASRESIAQEFSEAQVWANYLNQIWKPEDHYNLGTYKFEDYWRSAQIERCEVRFAQNLQCEISFYEINRYSVNAKARSSFFIGYDRSNGHVNEVTVLRSPMENLMHRVSLN